ncbi:MAG: AI-2E family transporter [Pseudomonadota bacterium]
MDRSETQSAGAVTVETESLREAALSSAEMPRVHMPPSAHGMALSIIAALMFVYALQWAQGFFIPLAFSILISYTLTPPVNALVRLRVPRAMAAALMLVALLGGAGAVGYALRSQFQGIVASLPAAAHKAVTLVASADGTPSTIQKMQTAASEIEKAAGPVSEPGGARQNMARPNAKAAAAPITVVVARPAFKLSDWLWAGSRDAAGALGQIVIVIFLVFFMLLAGDEFKRKLVKISGPTLSSKKITVQVLDAINKSIQHYMLMLLVTNVCLSLALWAVLTAIGLENAGAWAVAAGFVHIVPYFGVLIIAVGTGLAALLQFSSLPAMFLVAGASLAVASVVGSVLATWMTGKFARMNTAAVFIGVLFWAWLWGVWGMLLGVPIVVMIRMVAQHVESMQALDELLGN